METAHGNEHVRLHRPSLPGHVLISLYTIKTNLWTVEPAVSRGPRMGKKAATAYVLLSRWLTTYQLW